MLSPLSISDFLAVPGPILDVRSPGEFARAHIPGAMNFPLFSDEERAEVGTCYKHEGREQAVELGFEIVGPKCASFVKRAKRLAGDRQVRVHCWRGGMRSASMGWLLQTAGLKVSLLEGGYKAFRGWCLQQLQLPRPVILLGGMTGSGKTYILQALERLGEQIIDLEGLANHRGSSYGALGLPDQPSTEQFENKLAMEWHQLDPRRRVWLEAESRAVGSCRIPAAVFAQMEVAPVIRVRRSRQERIETISEMYGESDIEGLIAATQRIRKRLGGAAHPNRDRPPGAGGSLAGDRRDFALLRQDLYLRSRAPGYSCCRGGYHRENACSECSLVSEAGKCAFDSGEWMMSGDRSPRPQDETFAQPDFEADITTVRPDSETLTRQQLPYFVGISADTAGSTGISMNLVVIPPGGSAEPHFHRDYETAIYILDGTVKTFYGQGLRRSQVNQTGDFLFIPAGVPHQPFNLSETEAAKAIVSRNDANEQENVVLYRPEGES